MKQYKLEDLKTVTIVEPTIKPDPISFPNDEKGDKKIAQEYTDYMGDTTKMFAFMPLVEINKEDVK